MHIRELRILENLENVKIVIDKGNEITTKLQHAEDTSVSDAFKCMEHGNEIVSDVEFYLQQVSFVQEKQVSSLVQQKQVADDIIEVEHMDFHHYGVLAWFRTSMLSNLISISLFIYLIIYLGQYIVI